MKQILFIDVRNATRSQIAETWFNHLAGKAGKARSCGTLPAEQISGRTLQVMQEIGIDLSRKSPKPITQTMLNQADVVVLIGSGIYPRAFSPAQIWNLEDSTGKSIAQVRELRDQICQRVEQLITEIYRDETGYAEMAFRALAVTQLQSASS